MPDNATKPPFKPLPISQRLLLLASRREAERWCEANDIDLQDCVVASDVQDLRGLDIHQYVVFDGGAHLIKTEQFAYLVGASGLIEWDGVKPRARRAPSQVTPTRTWLALPDGGKQYSWPDAYGDQVLSLIVHPDGSDPVLVVQERRGKHVAVILDPDDLVDLQEQVRGHLMETGGATPGWRLALLRHDFDRKVGQHISHLVRRLLPNWLVTQALIKASRHIRDTETVPEVPFMSVYERQFKHEPAR